MCCVGVAACDSRRRDLPIPSSAILELADSVEPSCVRPIWRSRPAIGSPVANLLAGQSLGGEYRARTGDLLVANQALSQLS